MENSKENTLQETVISIRGLSKSFGEMIVLKDINLDLFAGENLVVLGRSGAGKSVLIKLLVKLLTAEKGSILILGEELERLSYVELNALRLKIGFSFQSSALYDSMNVRQNLEFPLKMNRKHLKQNEIDEAVEEVIMAVGLPDKIDTMPSDLSGGQKKRIGIARTLILKPQIMLYDEPTSGLDPVTSEEINKLIRNVQKSYNTSAIIITHDLTCAKETGDRMAMLVNGMFVKSGSFQEVFESDNDETKRFYNYNFTR